MGQEMSKDVSAGKIGSRRILVVDDDVDGAETLAILLRVAGHDVQVAHDGPSTLKIAAAFLPEVVFLDVSMPGMDGGEVLQYIQHTRPEIRVVLCSGIDEEEARATLFGHRPAGFLRKPYVPADLIGQLRSVW